MNNGTRYQNTCGFCREPLTGPPRHEAGGLCKHLHTIQGRRELESISKANRERKRVVDAVTAPVTAPVTASQEMVTSTPESGDR